MKTLVRILSIILLISMLAGIVSSCEKKQAEPQDETPTVEYKDYVVKVVDDFGNPMSDVIVKFVNSAGETKSRVTLEDGIASYKNAVAGKYLVVLEKGLSDVTVKQSEYQLTEKNTEITVVVRNNKNTIDLYGDNLEDVYGFAISPGKHKFVGNEGDRVYFVLNALVTGKYRFSYISDDSDMTIAYYGIPLFVQSTHRGEGEYDGKSFELDIRDTNAPYVIGLNYTKTTEATLVIERIGDPDFDPIFDVPVVSVNTKRDDLVQFDLPAGAEPIDFDITDPTASVVLGDDGYYYTADGQLLYLRLTSTGNEGNMSLTLPSIKEMLALGASPDAPVTVGGINFGGFVYDENGDYLENRIYNDLIESYYKVCDGKYGLYPLTDELAEAIKTHGENSGWWNMDNEYTCIFNSNVNAQNAWLFYCCTLSN